MIENNVWSRVSHRLRKGRARRAEISGRVAGRHAGSDDAAGGRRTAGQSLPSAPAPSSPASTPHGGVRRHLSGAAAAAGDGAGAGDGRTDDDDGRAGHDGPGHDGRPGGHDGRQVSSAAAAALLRPLYTAERERRGLGGSVVFRNTSSR